MFDFPIPNTPPRKVDKVDTSSLLYDLLEKMVERIEQDATDEKERVGAGIALRVNRTKKVLDRVFDYSLKGREQYTVETLSELREMLDRHLVEITAFCEKYPLPENDKI